jgi:hypothetical protein
MRARLHKTAGFAAVAATTLAVVAGILSLPVMVARPAAQKGGGNRMPSMSANRSRLDTLDIDFKLTKDQKKTIKGILDEAHKSAAPIRDGLAKTHASIAAAIQANKGQADVDAAVKSYAEQSTAMATVEMKALADVMKALDSDQRANSAAISTAFFLMRGAFLDPKKWDDLPDGRNY